MLNVENRHLQSDLELMFMTVITTRKQKQGENMRDFFQQLDVLKLISKHLRPENAGESLSATRSLVGSRRMLFDKDC